MRLRTERVRETNVSEEAGSDGVGGVEGVEFVVVGVREKGRCGWGRRR